MIYVLVGAKFGKRKFTRRKKNSMERCATKPPSPTSYTHVNAVTGTMSIKQSMRDIDRAVEDTVGTHEQYEAKKEGRSRRRVYEKSIEEVRKTAGKTEAERLAMWIETTIREEEKLPSGKQVRKKGAEICRDVGEAVSTNDWLGA